LSGVQRLSGRLLLMLSLRRRLPRSLKAGMLAALLSPQTQMQRSAECRQVQR
jgi:hypothetical protein